MVNGRSKISLLFLSLLLIFQSNASIAGDKVLDIVNKCGNFAKRDYEEAQFNLRFSENYKQARLYSYASLYFEKYTNIMERLTVGELGRFISVDSFVDNFGCGDAVMAYFLHENIYVIRVLYKKEPNNTVIDKVILYNNGILKNLSREEFLALFFKNINIRNKFSDILKKIYIRNLVLEDCSCPWQVDAIGNVCGERSAYSRFGGRAPICFSSQLGEDFVSSYWDYIFQLRVEGKDYPLFEFY